MHKFKTSRFAWAVGYLLTLHVAALVIFTLFRVALFLLTSYEIPAESNSISLIATAFVKGLWFDNVIACYILALPLVVMWIAGLCNYTPRWLYRTTAAWYTLFYAVAFTFTAANIPYFEYFFKIINSSIFNWFSYVGTTAGMIFGESSYHLPILLGSLAILGWGALAFYLAKRFWQKSLTAHAAISWLRRAIILVVGALLAGLCMLGIRGRMGYNPIKISQAYFCEDPFLNQIGVNPVFNLLTSALDDRRKENKQLELLDEEQALAHAQTLLGRKGIEGISPLAREVEASTAPNRKHVVVIFMESMSAHLLQAYGQEKALTPYLDSIYHHSLTFDRIYSAGIHTNHGLFSTLYSFPTIMKRNAMKGSVVPQYSGLPTTLQREGYRNLFFMTHESQYDNMNAFFRTNGFDEIYAEEDYPKEKIANHFGVADDYLYEYALPILSDRAASGNPFFAVLLSISNHPPYVIPPYFKPRSERIEDQIVEFADWSIAQFMAKAAKEPWFEDTIFLFLGDHGKLVGTPECEMPQSYNHIPLIIHGEGITPMHHTSFGGQIDIAPTLLHLLGISYTQNNFGVNLLNEERPCTFYTADNLIAARDEAHLYIYSPETGQEFCYDTSAEKIRLTEFDADFEALKSYCFAMLQSTEWMVRNKLTLDYIPEKERR
ncbi:MAG: sulfatase-like hydrolase/transferase [Rikenellaceae bacterium]|nr:sulfatase-like hydrolase/transferase [Rikenellaceae bacterium]